MDYKLLLCKYIEYMGEVSGFDGLGRQDNRYKSDVEFSKDEWNELESISERIWKNG